MVCDRRQWQGVEHTLWLYGGVWGVMYACKCSSVLHTYVCWHEFRLGIHVPSHTGASLQDNSNMWSQSSHRLSTTDRLTSCHGKVKKPNLDSLIDSNVYTTPNCQTTRVRSHQQKKWTYSIVRILMLWLNPKQPPCWQLPDIHNHPKQAYLVDPLITSHTELREMWCEVIVVNYIEVGDPDAIATTSRPQVGLLTWRWRMPRLHS